MNDFFHDRLVLVTGASSGLGEEFARQLAARGAKLVLTARRTERLEALAAELRTAHGTTSTVLTADLAQPGGAAELCRLLDDAGLRLDDLVSNAGFGSNGPFCESESAWQAEMVRVNCEALTVLSRHVLPGFVQRRAGGILHVASIAGFQPVPYMATYGATKAFVLSLSLALAEEVRGQGVRVMALCPGPVPTEFQAVAGSGIARSQRAATLDAASVVKKALSDYERGRTVCIPGALNQAQQFAAHVAPRSLVVRMVGRMMRAKRARALQAD